MSDDWRKQKMRIIMDEMMGQGWWDRMHDEQVEEARAPIDQMSVRLLSIDREATYEQASRELKRRMIELDKAINFLVDQSNEISTCR